MKRILTALVLIPIVVWVVLWANFWIFLAVLCAVAFLCWREYDGIAATYGVGRPGIPGLVAGYLWFAWRGDSFLFVVLLALLASINVFVALFNLLPLPPLDGGHAAVAIYEGIASKVRGRRVRVDYQKMRPVAAAVVVVILVFGLSTIYLDLRSL